MVLLPAGSTILLPDLTDPDASSKASVSRLDSTEQKWEKWAIPDNFTLLLPAGCQGKYDARTMRKHVNNASSFTILANLAGTPPAPQVELPQMTGTSSEKRTGIVIVDDGTEMVGPNPASSEADNYSDAVEADVKAGEQMKVTGGLPKKLRLVWGTHLKLPEPERVTSVELAKRFMDSGPAAAGLALGGLCQYQ
eukprot:8983043-Pyramimonas_sp.AAC.1